MKNLSPEEEKTVRALRKTLFTHKKIRALEKIEHLFSTRGTLLALYAITELEREQTPPRFTLIRELTGLPAGTLEKALEVLEHHGLIRKTRLQEGGRQYSIPVYETTGRTKKTLGLCYRKKELDHRKTRVYINMDDIHKTGSLWD